MEREMQNGKSSSTEDRSESIDHTIESVDQTVNQISDEGATESTESTTVDASLANHELPEDSQLSQRNYNKLVEDRLVLSRIKLTRRRGVLRPYEATYNNKGQQTYCTCRQIDDGEIMLQCDTCKEWLHGACIGVNEEESGEIDVFVCKGCHMFIKAMDQSKLEDADSSNAPSTLTLNLESKHESRQLKSPLKRTVNPSLKAQKFTNHTETQIAALSDKTRLMARKNFNETLGMIFSEVLLGKNALKKDECTVDLLDPKSFAVALEEQLFVSLAEPNASDVIECGQKYKSKYRSIQFNLKDKLNVQLRSRLLTGQVTINQLVTLSPEELASDVFREKSELLRAQNMHETVLIKSDDQAQKKQEAELLMLNIDHSQFQKPHASVVDDVMDVDDDAMHSAALKPVGLDITALIANIEKKRSMQEVNEVEKSKRIRTDATEQLQSEMSGGVSARRSATAGYAIPEHDNSVYTTGEDIDDLYIASPRTPTLDFSLPVAPVLDYTTQRQQHVYPYHVYSDEPVWNGVVSMEGVADFTGSCTQVGGNELDEQVWQDVLSTTIKIDGRIQPKAATDYINQTLTKDPTKTIVVVKFQPRFASDSGYKQIFHYFHSKDRYGVIVKSQRDKRRKDAYLVPLKAGMRLPEMFKEVGCVAEKVESDVMYAVIVVIGGGDRKQRHESKRETTRQREERVEGETTADVPLSSSALQGLLDQISGNGTDYSLFAKMNSMMNKQLE